VTSVWYTIAGLNTRPGDTEPARDVDNEQVQPPHFLRSSAMNTVLTAPRRAAVVAAAVLAGLAIAAAGAAVPTADADFVLGSGKTAAGAKLR
jgi:hypothetical protein